MIPIYRPTWLVLFTFWLASVTIISGSVGLSLAYARVILARLL